MPLNELWVQLLETERDRRLAKKAYDAGEGERRAAELWEQIEEIGERLAAATSASFVDALGAAADWPAIDALRLPADMPPADAVALIALRDPDRACRLMGEWAARRSA